MTKAKLLLEAVRLTGNGDIAALSQLLSGSNSLKLEHILRILLTYLPEATEPETYIPLLQRLAIGHSLPEDDQPTEANLQPINVEDARRRIQGLRLLPLAYPGIDVQGDPDPLTSFLLHQAHRAYRDTGSLDLVRRLLEPFIGHSEVLQAWMICILLPLLRIEYDYYTHSTTVLSLEEFEQMGGRRAIRTLLSQSARWKSQDQAPNTARDIRGLVGPWMYGERSREWRKFAHQKGAQTSSTAREPRSPESSSASDWSYVNEWILELSQNDFPRAVDTLLEWDGPKDVDYGDWAGEMLSLDDGQDPGLRIRYGQTGLAVIYANQMASTMTIDGSLRILKQVCNLARLAEPPHPPQPKSGVVTAFIGNITHVHLLYNSLLRQQNPLTEPTLSAIAFADIVLKSASKLVRLGSPSSCKDIVELILFRPKDAQRIELEKAMRALKSRNMSNENWISSRLQLLWLQDWDFGSNSHTGRGQGVFSKIASRDIELELLRATLDAGCSKGPLELYFKKNAPLPQELVKETVIDTALAAYDAASNGYRIKGGLKKASDIITNFRMQFPTSQRFAQIEALLAATHSMSFYSLLLRHGVPFQPVDIRAHKDPMSLIAKILEQNPRSYTHLDDLLEIGQNLVAAGLGQADRPTDSDSQAKPDIENEKLIARRRVTRMAIEAALAEDDFDTAYSYIVNRLSAIAKPNYESEQSPDACDDISWRAAYAAGRYPTSGFGSTAIRRVEQRMELLSQALLLAPPSALAELLDVWQNVEQNLNELLAQEAAHEDQADERQLGQHIPGGFGDLSPVKQKAREWGGGRAAMQEEAPMGLFDAAREVGAALSKNAFPLRGAQKAKSPSQGNEEAEKDSHGDSEGTDRVRKRDMVSNMVTGGLASGIGWVIGAPPIKY